MGRSVCMQIPGWWEKGYSYWQITVLDNYRKVRICWSGDGDIASIPIHTPINNVVDESESLSTIDRHFFLLYSMSIDPMHSHLHAALSYLHSTIPPSSPPRTIIHPRIQRLPITFLTHPPLYIPPFLHPYPLSVCPSIPAFGRIPLVIILFRRYRRASGLDWRA